MSDTGSTNGSGGSKTESHQGQPASREDWEWLPKHPDLIRDLGYELVDLEMIDVADSDEVLLLPREESMGESDSFIIADREDVVTPVD